MFFGRKKNQPRKSSRRTQRPAAEVLEVRSLLSVTLSGGVLSIIEGSRADTVNVSLVANDPTKLDVCENGRHKLFNVSQVNSIKANLGNGNDLFEIDQRNGQITKPTTILGGRGNDTLFGGGGVDSIDGGSGNDVLRGQAGNDLLKGGIGNDNLDGGNGNDQVFGGAGDDTLEGGNGNDTLMGEAGNDELDGEVGNDVVNGGDGNDTVKGGEGTDSVTGGAGDDQFDPVDDLSELLDKGNGTDSAETLLENAPQAVQDAANGLLGGAVSTSFLTEYTGTETVYAFEWTADGIDRSALVAPDGTVTEETQEIDAIALPLAVTAAVHGRYRSGQITEAALRTAGTESSYEVNVTTRGVIHEMLLSEAGQILEDDLVPLATPTSTVDRFRDFSASGTSAFFNLNPGSVLTLEGPSDTGETERLVITVLDAVKMVDGVETRVVEERAFINGELIEVAKNFFAMDEKTGNVYYFGEDVDNYENGQIANHKGSWQSGVSGAKFGLLVPGSPREGFAFVEENAPPVAQDRGRIVSTTESVSTPAGDFTGVIKVEETSPLDATLDFKHYVRGIGLVQSNDLKLISYTLV